MTWKQRQALGLCQYPCAAESSDGDYCRLHALMALDRKRYWWTYRRHHRRPKQLCLVLEMR
jgi:hypothetical protein